MEMKERYDTLKVKLEEAELNKREELIERRQKKASDLEARALTVLRARQVKADATKEYLQKKKEMEKKEIEIKVLTHSLTYSLTHLTAHSINRESVATATKKYPHRLTGTYVRSAEDFVDTRPSIGGH